MNTLTSHEASPEESSVFIRVRNVLQKYGLEHVVDGMKEDVDEGLLAGRLMEMGLQRNVFHAVVEAAKCFTNEVHRAKLLDETAGWHIEHETRHMAEAVLALSQDEVTARALLRREKNASAKPTAPTMAGPPDGKYIS